MWPGFGENSRILKWIFDRTENQAAAQKTPIGYIPTLKSLDISGLNINEDTLRRLLFIDKEAWKKEVSDLEIYFSRFGEKLPQEIHEELKSLEDRLQT
jgi:phosphoenolpyruvate carboxykinase (GTP)